MQNNFQMSLCVEKKDAVVEDRYQCEHPRCSKFYVTKSNLMRHVRERHEGIVNTHVCPCGAILTSPTK